MALSGCPSTFPKEPACLIGDHGCVCYDPRTQLDFDLTFEQCRNYIAYSPDSWNAINEWMQRNCK